MIRAIFGALLVVIGLFFGGLFGFYNARANIPPSERDWVRQPGVTTAACGPSLEVAVTGARAPMPYDVASNCRSIARSEVAVGAVALILFGGAGAVLLGFGVRAMIRKRTAAAAPLAWQPPSWGL